MSAKWIRSKQWDDDHFPTWAWPAKAILRAFSSIPLAVVLLSLIVLYSTLASVPVGLMALGITYFIYLLTILLTIAVLAILPLLILRRLWKPAPTNTTLRFIASLALLLLLTGAAVQLWLFLLWPTLHYDPATGSGLRLFGSFVDTYRSTTLRRLPGFEMSEPEFYSWWPLRLILALFILNMITATVRRIEFSFPNLGVLTVHTGIVTIALGSMYYRGLKIEGDTLLLAGQTGPDGKPNPGPIQDRFYDNMSTALWLNQNSALWDQRPIQPPRYNDYGLSVAGWPTARALAMDAPKPDSRSLNTRVPDAITSDPSRRVIDPDLRFRIVGYANYANPVRDWVQAPPPPAPAKPNPMRFLDLKVSFPDRPDAASRSAFRFFLAPDSPANRTSDVGDALSIEYTRALTDTRWHTITAPLPQGTLHALDITIPGETPAHTILPIKPGDTHAIAGYTITVKDLSPKPPFPIITEGYQNATSSIAILRITPPAPAKPFDRWIYHRFPEISQDMLDELNERGMPKRRDADPAIAITYIDATRLHIFLDEKPDGAVRAAIRLPTGQVRTVDDLNVGSTIEAVATRSDPAKDPKIDLVLGERWDHAESIERPQVVPESEQNKSDVGTHTHSMLAVEITCDASPLSNTLLSNDVAWTKIVWLPFVRYHHVEDDKHREITLPDGRQIRMAFGRLAHRFPNFFIQLANFEMIAYDHRGSPRDYQSIVRVVPSHTSADSMAFKPYEHITKLNAPLQAPFIWSEDRSYISNLLGTLKSRLNPNQFKFSQAGWDAEGWRRTQEATDRGELPRPFASFTILGVGNNPGIHIIALGGILMSLGIPWAFYLKPLILKHRKQKIQKQLAAGTYQRPRQDPHSDASHSDSAVSQGIPAPVPVESPGAPS
jgi:hypothetical protein